MGYELGNTLSENGSVSRGVCEVDSNNNLVQIVERLKVYDEKGKIVYEEGDGSKHQIPENFKASMNFWCFHPSLFGFLETEFQEFLKQNIENTKAEFLIKHSADRFIKTGKGIIKVIPTAAQWFGVTYKEDAPVVKRRLEELVTDGAYPPSLWKA
jgi:flavin-dependent dehydrogenase